MSSLALALTLMVPYLEISETTALSSALDYNGMHWAANIVSIGAIFALSCTVISNIMCTSRITYAISSEGLLFRFLSRVNRSTQVPIFATIFGATITILMTFFIPLQDLTEMLAFGNLLAYAFVAFAVIKLRTTSLKFLQQEANNNFLSDEKIPLIETKNENEPENHQNTSIDSRNDKNNTWNQRQCISAVGLLVFAFLACIFLRIAQNSELSSSATFVVTSVISAGCLVAMMSCLVCFWRLSNTNLVTETVYRVPLVPFFPAFSIFVNFYLMVQLSTITWIR